ncbi:MULTISPECIES: M56 family metallopeptidase [Prauserella]|uniref:Peptidase n=2 Tax=Prauserella TaxID=142577 RepID=A0A318LCE4_9PSEU|nr:MULTISPECIES: M56 family metallopeptidase [Prauserella]PXY16779.1 peptidase [Prauserella coralliicola]PXY17486.1 peptidase [Prauserella flavalba]TKG59686.1 M56 family metallopeptidase [Prauserella endophytica]
MIVAVSLLLGALAAGWFVPRQLLRADLRRRDPRPLIAAWLLAMSGVALAGITGVVLLLAPDHAAPSPLTWALSQCWTALQHGSPPKLEEIIGVLSAAILAGLIARFAIVAVREFLQWRRASHERLAVLRLVARTDDHSPKTLWLAHDRPLAFSLGNRPGVIVATEGLRRHLSPEGVAAVLAHERAHLRGRHHLLILIAGILRRTMPFVPLFQQADTALRELVELAADVSAVRTCGASAVRSALLGVAGPGTPEVALAMARDAVTLRLARLQHAAQPAGGFRAALSCGIAGMAATALPFLTSAALLLGVTIVACPANGW